MLTHRFQHPSSLRPAITPGASFVLSIVSTLAVLLSASNAQAIRDRVVPNYEGDEVLPRGVQEVGIDDKAGQTIPKGIVLRDEEGKSVAFDSYFNGKQPVVLVLAYYSCPMLCTVVLNGVNAGLREVAWTMGQEYRVLTVSIDPHDTPDLAKAKRDNYLKDYGRQVKPDSWHFLTGDEASIKRLAEAVGFRYHWDEPTKQYAHAAGAFILSPELKISRTLYGINFPGKDLRLALIEASNGAFVSAIDRILLFCFHYEPKTGKYILAASRLMKVSAGSMAVLVAIWITRFWRRESLRLAASKP